MGDFEKIFDICIKTCEITGDILKAALRDFLNNKTVSKGNIGYGDLAQRANGRLEAIEVTDNNIRNFLDVAKKYDVNFSLKRDKSTTPPTYHVFFATSQTENLKRAFSEYVFGIQGKDTEKNYTVTCEQVNENAKKISHQSKEKSKEKVRTRQKTQSEVR